MEEKLVQQVLKRLSPKTWPANLGIKVISFCFALFLWFFVVGEDKVDTDIVVPLEITNIPQDMVISNQFKRQLEVSISGSRTAVRALANQHVTRSVDLSKVSPGTIVISNQAGDIPLPRGIRVLRIQPTHITLVLDTLVRKELGIKALTKGRPPEDYELVSVSLKPEKLDVSGPKFILEPVDHLTTELIDISDLTVTSRKQVRLALSAALSDLIGEPMVSALINVKEKTDEKTINNIRIETDKPEGKGLRLSAKSVSIKAEMPMGMIRRGSDFQNLFHATITVNGLSPGSHERSVDVVAPPSTKVLSVTPDKITVEVSGMGEKEK